MDPAEEQETDAHPGGGSMANCANGTNGTNGTNGQLHQTPEGSLYQEDNDESDMDDEAQEDEELLSQPLQINPSSVMDASTSSMVHLNNFMSSHAFFTKLRQERNEADMLQSRNGLEVLHAAMSNSNFGNLFPPLYMTSPPPPSHLPQPLQNNHLQVAGNLGNQVTESSQTLACTASSSRTPASASQPNESSPPRCRNNGESAQGNSRNNGESSQTNTRNNGETREGETRAASVNSQHPSGANWSFEEQFRQLYELDDSSERKIFLDNLFSFMQSRVREDRRFGHLVHALGRAAGGAKQPSVPWDYTWNASKAVSSLVKGTPISRLPIMAKSVLDLFELYKLVVHRGGLVEVINKKLWQEIIKGLRLPASITSAAFTLRTQYMKYLYPYERDKEALSTQEQLQTAIETNRRESRRNNYAYPNNSDSLQRNHNSLPQNPLPMPLTIAQMAAAANESQHHIVNGHPHGPHPQHLSQNLGSGSNLDYMLRILRDRSTIPNNPIMQGSTSTPPPAATEGFKSVPYWSLYNQSNNNLYTGMVQPSFSPSSSHSPLAPANSPEPQREALDLANSGHRSESSPASRSVNSPLGREVKRNQETAELSSPIATKKFLLYDEDGNNMHSVQISQRLLTRENGEKLLEISANYNGSLFEGVIAEKQTKREDNNTPSSPHNNEKRTPNTES